MRFKGEQEALDRAIAIGFTWGFGNVIDVLKTAWSKGLQKDSQQSAQSADLAAGHICVWCYTDSRTGKKVKLKSDPSGESGK